MTRLFAAFSVLAFTMTLATSQTVFKPNADELRAAYQRADDVQKLAENAVFNATLTFGWIANGAELWYRRDSPDGKREFVRVDASKKSRLPAFDHKILAAALAAVAKREVDSDALPFTSIAFDASSRIAFRAFGDNYTFDPATSRVEKGGPFDSGTPLQTAIEPEPNPEYPAPYAGRYDQAPQQRETNIRVRDGQIQTRSGEVWTTVTTQGSYSRAEAEPTTGKIVAFRLIPGDRRLVYLLKSAVANSTRAALEQRLYDQPGDKLDEFETWLIDPVAKTESKVDLAPIMGGGQPWANPPGIRWRGGFGFFDFPIRGYQEHKLVSLNPTTGLSKVVVHEISPTFIDQSKTNYWLVGDGKQIIWQSERNGRSHLYLVDVDSGNAKPITTGEYIVRGITHLNESAGQVWFTANGFGDPAKTDPYHLHLCRINLDGSGFVRLTKGEGTHSIQLSPDRKWFVDTYSRADYAPIHELRDSQTGRLVIQLEKSNADKLSKNGLRLPERFVAKGRDGKTDIWGIVVRPSNFDSKKKYPVIENIYAGPHDSFVPKGFRPFLNMHRLAELGFIVVQIDGMGTNNRGKAFHDVAWKNVADAGFPDRILWMKSLAKKYPQADIERVGVYGTSAGGQSSTGAVLLHGEFYKAAVSSCGCHDNRIDKQWWNEQWMGYPVGPHYDEQSNITNAGKLKGKLMLIVGEQDRNVPPESTFRLADALIKARKEFDLVVIPGADHTDGGPYGERKRRDFFVRWLHGVEPPRSND